MKKYQALLIFTILCLTAVRVLGKNIIDNEIERLQKTENDYGEKELQDILRMLRKNPNIVSSTILIDNKEKSIKDYLDSPDLKGSIKKQHIIEISQLINILLSCEYSKINYYYTKLIERVFDQYILRTKKNQSDSVDKILKAINQYFTKLQTISDHISTNITLMIYTLVGLEKLTKPTVSKNQNILRLLISWYTVIASNKARLANCGTDKKFPILDCIEITNYQVQNRLEQFMIKNCYQPEGLMTLKNDVDARIKNINNFLGLKYLKETNKLVNSITYPKLFDEKEKNRFVFFYGSDTGNDRLMTIISKEISSPYIISYWDNQSVDLKKMYKDSVMYSLKPRAIIIYEKLILDKIIEIIKGYVSKTLKNILGGASSDSKKRQMCYDQLLEKVENYVQLLKVVGHPIYLLNNMMSIKIDLVYVCSLMSSKNNNNNTNLINQYISNWDNSKAKDFVGRNFDSFLNTLSTMVVCGRLHPAISNTYLERFDYYSTIQTEFVVDYQYLHTGYHTDSNPNPLCDRLPPIQEKIDSLQAKINECLSITKGVGQQVRAANSLEVCFISFNTMYNEIINYVVNVISNRLNVQDMSWHLLAMTMIYNKSHVKLFDQTKQKYFDNSRIQHLMTFTYVVRLMFEDICHRSCGLKKPSNILYPPQKSSNRGTPAQLRAVYIRRIDELKIDRTLFQIFSHEQKFSNFNNATQRLLAAFPEVKLKLHLGTAEMTLAEVHDNYNNYIFEIQDFYDYSYYVLRWMTTLTYSTLVDNIVDRIATKNDLTLSASERTELQTLMREFFDLDRFSVTNVIIQRYISRPEDMISNMNTLRRVFESLGLVNKSVPQLRGSKYSPPYNAFFSDIQFIVEIYFNHIILNL